jgi:hypothetical protein
MNMIEAPYEEEGSSFCGGPIISPPLKLKEKQNYSESLLVITIDWHNGTRLLVSLQKDNGSVLLRTRQVFAPE